MLNSSVLKTLTFFDAQDLPLTLLEIKAYLDRPATISQIEQTIQSELSDEVATDGVFYFLQGREELVGFRHQRYRISAVRMRRVRKYLYFLRFLPFIRGAAVSGSQAVLGSKPGSDIDLFIITAKNRIWLARSLATLFFQLTGSRRHGRKTKNRFCLNHYIDEEVKIEQDQNLYTAMLYASFLPVFGSKHFLKFYKKNQWMTDYLAEPILEDSTHFFQYETSWLQRVLELILELILLAPLFNLFSRVYQKHRITPQDFVYVSDRELSFHPHSKGQRILAKFRQKNKTRST